MFNGLKVIDFHAHFPTANWLDWRVSWKQRVVERYGEKNAQMLM